MRIAIVCASGIGDALLFHPLSPSLQKLGWEVSIYSDHLVHLKDWLPSTYHFKPQPRLEQIPYLFSPYDAILLQHDNSLKAKAIEKLPIPLFRFYGSYSKNKHAPFHPEKDFICNPERTMVQNISDASSFFFRSPIDLVPQFIPPEGLIHRRYKQRIAIHPTASSFRKRWPKKKFLKLAHSLEKRGFEPIFLTSPWEEEDWPSTPTKTLADLCTMIYESGGMIGNDSGPGHLASLLQIPHLIIGADGLQMPLWKPGWLSGELVVPPSFLMRYKALRNRWDYFIHPETVVNKFINKYATI